MIVCLFVRGAGHGAIGIPALSAADASVPKENLALATTAMNIVQRLGGPIATTIIAIVLALSANNLPSPGPQAFMMAFALLTGLQLLVLGAAGRLPAETHVASGNQAPDAG